MVVIDTAPVPSGMVWPRLAGGCPGGQARVAWGWFNSSSCLTVTLAQGYRTSQQLQDLATSNLQLRSSGWSGCMHGWYVRHSLALLGHSLALLGFTGL